VADVKFTDLKDGTVSIMVTDPVDTAFVSVAVFDGKFGGVYQQVASFAEDGTEVVALPPGPYFGYVNDGTGFNPPLSFRVSDGSRGDHGDFMHHLREFLLNLSLPMVPSDPLRHKIHKRPVRSMAEFGDGKITQQIFGVHYWMLPESRTPADSCRTRVRYPVQVVVVQSSGGNNEINYEWTYTREIASRAMSRCPIPDAPHIHTVEVTPQDIYINAGGQSLQMDIQSLIFTGVTEQANLIL
jgi:hypothetical protein